MLRFYGWRRELLWVGLRIVALNTGQRWSRGLSITLYLHFAQGRVDRLRHPIYIVPGHHGYRAIYRNILTLHRTQRTGMALRFGLALSLSLGVFDGQRNNQWRIFYKGQLLCRAFEWALFRHDENLMVMFLIPSLYVSFLLKWSAH